MKLCFIIDPENTWQVNNEKTLSQDSIRNWKYLQKVHKIHNKLPHKGYS